MKFTTIFPLIHTAHWQLDKNSTTPQASED